MEEHVLEFSSVTEAKDCLENKIRTIKERLDVRLGNILEGLSEVESKIKTDTDEFTKELESLRGYRDQTISLFGPNAPNIEIIDNKISQIEEQFLTKSQVKPIKLKWNDSELLGLISELGCIDTGPTSHLEKGTYVPLNTYKSTPKRASCDDVTLDKQSEPQYQSEIDQKSTVASKIISKSKDLTGELVHTKPFISRKPLITRADNLRKSISLDSPSETQGPSEILRSVSLAPNVKPTKNPDLTNQPGSKITISREASPKIENENGEDSEYLNMNRESGSYCEMSSDPLQVPSSISPMDSISSLPSSGTPLSPNLSPGGPSEDMVPKEPIHDYEEIDIPLPLEKSPPKSPRYPRFPSSICCPEGAQKGQIMKPKAICVDRNNGTLYVAEKGNSRVQVFSPLGEHVSFFVDKSGSCRMNNPYGICIVNNQVYVTQSSSHCVHIYTLTGAFIKKFGKEGHSDGKFKLPSNITANPTKKQIYICDTGNDRVQAFDFSNSFTRHFGVGQLLKPVDIDIDSGGKVVVLDRGPKCVHVFAISGEQVFSIIAFGTFRQVINPLFFTLDQNDLIYMSDYARNSVFVFSMDGGLKGEIGVEGVFVEPRGLVFDNSGRLVVVSCHFPGCLQFYDL